MFGLIGQAVEERFNLYGGDGAQCGQRFADRPFGERGAGGDGGGAAFGLKGGVRYLAIFDQGAQAEYVSADRIRYLYL